MKTYLECVSCILRQVVNTLELCDTEEDRRREAVKKILKELEGMDYDKSPAINSNMPYHIISQVTGIEDPYRNIKLETNQAALNIYSRIQGMISSSEDSMYTAARAAIASNVIDFSVHLSRENTLDLEAVLDEIRHVPLSHDDYPEFVRELENSKKILYLADNAGEIVFDRLFIESILKTGKSVTVSVKSGPIINDATMEDARFVGLESMVDIVETGSNYVGVNLGKASDAFLQEFESADIIISKGMGNFETLDETRGKKIFFLLKAKCERIARELGVDYLDVVFMKNKYYQ